MKKILFLTLITCVLALTAFAQNKTDFSGDWELDTVRSKMDERMRVESMTMKVAQTEKELKVETTAKRAVQTDAGMNRGGGGMGGGTQTATYSLMEGTSLRSSPGERSSETVIRKASWESDGKLKLSSTREIDTQTGAMTIKTNETWELADEGKTLKISRETETPRGTNSSELVFARKNKANDSGDPSLSVSTSSSTAEVTKIISGGVLNGKATNLVKPEYPPGAGEARGAVNVQVTIDEEGNVISAKAVSGHPLLRPASEDAAKKSKFKPTLLEGKPVKLTGIIVYNFVAP